MTWLDDIADRDLTVSVVLPTHERPEMVHEAIRSVISQEFAGTIEVLVVFDNCEPHPIEVTCPPRRTVRTLVNDERTPGLAGARNTGILAATGELMGFCDDDDAWLPGKLQAQVDTLRSLPYEALCTTGSLIVGDSADHVRPGPDGVIPFERFLHSRVMELAAASFLVRRSTLIDGIGLVDEGLPASYAEDYDLLLRASRTLAVVNVPAPLVQVAFHGGSFYLARWRTMIEGLTYLLDKHPELRAAPRGRARIEGQLAFAYAASGDRGRAVRAVRAALRGNRLEKRAYVASLVVAGVPATWIAGLARRRGHGI